MKTIHTRITLIGIIFAVMTFVACDDFLDVRPKSEKL